MLRFDFEEAAPAGRKFRGTRHTKSYVLGDINIPLRPTEGFAANLDDLGIDSIN